MDFVTGLPWSDGHDAIWVVVDRLTNMRHLVPCRSDTAAPDLADLFLVHVFKHHGLPNTIVSDRGPQFAFDFWGQLCKRLKIDRRLSTASHPQSDGQTEIVNAAMEQYLRCYVDYLQDDWKQWLPLAEFAANNQVSDTTRVSPFFGNYRFNPTFDYTAPEPYEESGRQTAKDAQDLASTMHEIFSQLQVEMLRTQAIHQDNANRRREPTPSFKVGDRVFLDSRYVTTRRPSKKLDYKRQGPFEITAKISTHAYSLALPDTMKIHNVFHVSRLTLDDNNPYPGQTIPPPPPVEVEGEDEYFIEDILDSRLVGRRNNQRLQYLVKWLGYDKPSWEPAEYLEKVEAVDRFHLQHSDKPGIETLAS